MMLASLSYLIIQIPAFFYKNTSDSGVSEEAPFALTGVIVTFGAFCAYCWFQYSSAQRTEMTRIQQEALRRDQWKKSLDHKVGTSEFQEIIFKKHDKDNSGYIEIGELKNALEELGLKGERRDINNLLEQIDIGHKEDGDEGKRDGRISLNEFKAAVNKWVREGKSSRGGNEKKVDDKSASTGKQIIILHLNYFNLNS